MFYHMTRRCPQDGALINLVSHWDIAWISGREIKVRVIEPVKFEIDADFETESLRMPTFFTTPAFVGTDVFCRDLREAGVTNLQEYRAVIVNPQTGQKFENYRVLNIVGLVACAAAGSIEFVNLGPGFKFFDKITLKESEIPDNMLMFRLAEDTTKIVAAENLIKFLGEKGYKDIYWEPLKSR